MDGFTGRIYKWCVWSQEGNVLFCVLLMYFFVSFFCLGIFRVGFLNRRYDPQQWPLASSGGWRQHWKLRDLWRVPCYKVPLTSGIPQPYRIKVDVFLWLPNQEIQWEIWLHERNWKKRCTIYNRLLIEVKPMSSCLSEIYPSQMGKFPCRWKSQALDCMHPHHRKHQAGSCYVGCGNFLGSLIFAELWSVQVSKSALSAVSGWKEVVQYAVTASLSLC